MTAEGEKISAPLITLPSEAKTGLSFTNLIEVHVLSALRRKHKLSMQKIRPALDFIEAEFRSNHPLAEHYFETDGMSLFVEKYGSLIDVSKNGQLAMKEILSVYLTRVDRDENGMAMRLYPFTRSMPVSDSSSPRMVLIDPTIAFGKPVIAGTGVPTEIIAERYKTGESIGEIAEDYGLEVIEIEEAIRCEFELKAA
ncbi:MAG: DUF433 domain-containing protein [Acidobacteria bacterium]|nr:DUF433 domain-containing protein [Acidobacteriota bacterium]